MEPLNPIVKKPKEKEQHIFDPPPYCKKRFPVIPLADECIPLPLKLEASDPTKLMYFMENFTGVTSNELEHDINTYLRHECGASDVFMIHILRVSGQGRVKMLTDRVLDNEVIHPLSMREVNSLIKWNGENYYCAPNLSPEVHKIARKVLGRKGDPMNVVPILCRCRRERDETLKIYGNPVALVCLINCEKLDTFVLRIVQELFRYCTTTLLNTIECEEERRLKRNCFLLLEGCKHLFFNIHDLDKLLKEIMINAKLLTNAERCILFLLDTDHLHWVNKVFSPDPAAGLMEVRIAKAQAIAAHVAATNRVLNISNPTEHPLYHKYEDRYAGVKAKNILTFPISYEAGMVGVGQIFNKKLGSFDVFDEQLVETFSVYCGISLMHCLVYKKMLDSIAREKVAQQLILYKREVSMEEVAAVICCENCHKVPDFDSFSFIPRTIIPSETVCYILKMFNDLNYLDKYQIRDTVLVKFFLLIKKSYRDEPYRNWMHGFATGHFAYLLLKHMQLVEKRYISPLEGLSFLISAFIHDVDHSCTSNPFHLKTNSVLANLYSSENSISVKQHLNQALIILTQEGCNILEGLDDHDYCLCLEVIKDLVVSTDLMIPLSLQHKQKKICTDLYQNFNASHRYYLCALLMTAADLSDFVKDWSNTKNIAWFLLQEHFKFGDAEKKFNRKPLPSMDRDVALIPELIVEFLGEICTPVYGMVCTIFPVLTQLQVHLQENIELWKRCKNIFSAEKGEKGLDLLASEKLNMEIENIRILIQKEKESTYEIEVAEIEETEKPEQDI